MKKRIIFATGNENKLVEINEIFAESDIEVISMKAAGIAVDIVEDGKSFEENAIIKAKSVWAVSGGIVMADDSGLVVDYIGGEPGVHSARYLGRGTSYEFKNSHIINCLKDARGVERAARFVASIVCILENGDIITTTATMEGRIAYEPSGSGGFGYDPILYLPEYDKTSAELSLHDKNKISHRGKALRLMREKLMARGI